VKGSLLRGFPTARGEPSRLAEAFTHDTLTIDANCQFSTYRHLAPNYEDYRDQNTVFSGLAIVTFPLPLKLGRASRAATIERVRMVSGNFSTCWA